MFENEHGLLYLSDMAACFTLRERILRYTGDIMF